MISFNKGDVKTVHADRQKIDSIGKMALKGQGNCHGCSSVMGAFLYPFSRILGIDLKYRGGCSFKVEDNEEVKNNVERHQWLEITCRPSMETFQVDLWYEGVNEDDTYVGNPIDHCYSQMMYPNGKLIIGSKSL